MESSSISKLKVLWLAPSFNHYKARFLNHLASHVTIELNILAGTGREGMGDLELEARDWNFKLNRLNISKSEFGNSKVVKNELKKIFALYDWILIPAEKKNLSLLLFAAQLRKKNQGTRLFSYNHPIFKSNSKLMSALDKTMTKFFYRTLDRIIFYTKQGHDWAIEEKLISKEKAYWANNTIDELEIGKYYNFEMPPKDKITILFIGRLIPNKRIDLLFDYYKAIKSSIIKENVFLEIIGDGIQNSLVKKAMEEDSSITWHGALIEEKHIAPIMKRSSIVFIPGHSGLSINHAFAYGRPYITLASCDHAPEIDYLEHGKSGLLLEGDFKGNCDNIVSLLTNQDKLYTYCKNANIKGLELSVNNWVSQMKNSLAND